MCSACTHDYHKHASVGWLSVFFLCGVVSCCGMLCCVMLRCVCPLHVCVCVTHRRMRSLFRWCNSTAWASGLSSQHSSKDALASSAEKGVCVFWWVGGVSH